MLKIVFFLCLVAFALADPTPTGGANCTSDLDCGGIDGGVCKKNTTHTNHTVYGTCVCSKKRADPDCSYHRHNGNLAGGLQLLCLIGVGGVGNFIIGRSGPAIGQLVLMLAYLFAICGGCFALCAWACCSGISKKLGACCGVTVGAIASTIICLSVIAGWVWSIIDAAAMFGGRTDGEGYNLWT